MSLSDILNGVQSVTRKLDSVIHPEPPTAPDSGASSGAPISLGDFDFDGMEGTERVSSGMSQNHTIHTLSGGRRIVDAHGPEAKPVKWKGWLFGEDARARSRQLKSMAGDGQQRTLAWGEEDMDVLVIDVDTDERHPFLFDYSITVIVLDTRKANSDFAPSALASAKADLTSAAAYCPTSSSDLGAILSSAQSAISTVQSIAQTGAAFVGTLQEVDTAITSRLSSANALIRQIGSIGKIGSTGDTISSLQTAQTALNDIYRLGGTAGYLGRTINGLTGATIGG